MINPIAIAIPFFLVLIAVEAGVAWRQNKLALERPIFRIAPMVADLGCGISSQLVGLILSGVVATGIYVAVYELSPLKLPMTLPVWIGTFLIVDFLYYWWHRASHRVNLLWAAHVVHHQSEDFNLAVALRQGMFTSLTSIPFYLILPILGVPPLILLTCLALNTLYQFWFHTRLINKTPWLDWLFNTPTHHRVHHGINPWAIDRNHAGVFIVWDKLFGTFVVEHQEPVYGVVEGYRSWNPIEANVEPYFKLLQKSAALQGIDRLLIFFRPPEWTPTGPAHIPEPTQSIRNDQPTGTILAVYLILWVLIASLSLLFILLFPENPSVPLLGFLCLATLGGLGNQLNRIDRMARMEQLRLTMVAMSGFYWGIPFGVATTCLALFSLWGLHQGIQTRPQPTR